MDSRIHLSQIWKIIEEKDRLGKPKPFSFQYVKSSKRRKERPKKAEWNWFELFLFFLSNTALL